MTTIIAYKGEHSVWMASDTMASHVGNKVKVSKVLTYPNTLVGFSGDIELMNAVYTFNMHIVEDPYEFILNKFIPGLRKHLKEICYKYLELEESSLIISFKNRIFEINPGFTFLERDLSTVGSGGELALGSLMTALRHKPFDPSLLVQAVDIASEHDIHTGMGVRLYNSALGEVDIHSPHAPITYVGRGV